MHDIITYYITIVEILIRIQRSQNIQMYGVKNKLI